MVSAEVFGSSGLKLTLADGMGAVEKSTKNFIKIERKARETESDRTSPWMTTILNMCKSAGRD